MNFRFLENCTHPSQNVSLEDEHPGPVSPQSPDGTPNNSETWRFAQVHLQCPKVHPLCSQAVCWTQLVAPEANSVVQLWYLKFWTIDHCTINKNTNIYHISPKIKKVEERRNFRKLLSYTQIPQNKQNTMNYRVFKIWRLQNNKLNLIFRPFVSVY